MKKKYLLFPITPLLITLLLIACTENHLNEFASTPLTEPRPAETEKSIPLEVEESKLREIIDTHTFPELIYMPENLYFFTSDDLPEGTGMGYEWIVPPILDIPPRFDGNNHGLLRIENTEDLERFIGDISGRVIAIANTGTISHYFDGMLFVEEDSNWTAVDIEHEIITPLGHFHFFHPHPDLNLISVRIGDLFDETAREGVIDFTGQQIIPIQFSGFTSISEGLAATGVRDPTGASNVRWGFSDIVTGEVVIPHTFRFANPFSEGFAAVAVASPHSTHNHRWGSIDKDGQLVVPAIYASVRSFSEGMAAVRYGCSSPGNEIPKYGFVDTTGNEVVPPTYAEVKSFSEGRAAVRAGHWLDDNPMKWGFIDQTGKEVIPPMYEDVRSFSNGLAAVQIDGKWGYINIYGEVVIPPVYTIAKSFNDGLARVYYGGYAAWLLPCDGRPTPFDGEWHFINKQGETVATLDYLYVGNIINGLAPVRIGEHEMFFCSERNVYLPTQASWRGRNWGLVRILFE